jgi:hypothetical protein
MTESFAFCADVHGDRQDTRAVAVFRKFLDAFKPKFRIFGGDLWDFRSLRAAAGDSEKQHSLLRDFSAGMEFLEAYRPQVFLLGNHDMRLWDAVQRDGLRKGGPIADLATEKIAEFERLAAKLKIRVLPYEKRKGVWKRSGVSFCHGFATGPGAVSAMARVYGNCCFGHGHSVDVASEPGIAGPKIARMVGCLCRLDMVYARTHLAALRQTHGWAYGVFRGPSRASVFQAEVVGGRVLFAGKFGEVSA